MLIFFFDGNFFARILTKLILNEINFVKIMTNNSFIGIIFRQD